MDRVRERADSLRELDLDDVGQGLDKTAAADERAQLQDNREEDDVAIAEAIADVEEEIKASDKMMTIPLAFLLVIVAWLFRDSLIPALEFMLGPVGGRK